MNRKRHWEGIHHSRPPHQVTWYQEHLAQSLALINNAGLPSSAHIIDVGAGSSTLAKDLVEAGYSKLTILDLSGIALKTVREQLSAWPASVCWVQGDITQISFPENQFHLWHDRAVFHFLTAAEDRQAYLRCLKRSIGAGGQVIVGTFALSGPSACSGLDVVRYSGETLSEEFGDEFEIAESILEEHVAPSGVKQDFQWCRLVRVGQAGCSA